MKFNYNNFIDVVSVIAKRKGGSLTVRPKGRMRFAQMKKSDQTSVGYRFNFEDDVFELHLRENALKRFFGSDKKQWDPEIMDLYNGIIPNLKDNREISDKNDKTHRDYSLSDHIVVPPPPAPLFSAIEGNTDVVLPTTEGVAVAIPPQSRMSFAQWSKWVAETYPLALPPSIIREDQGIKVTTGANDIEFQPYKESVETTPVDSTGAVPMAIETKPVIPQSPSAQPYYIPSLAESEQYQPIGIIQRLKQIGLLGKNETEQNAAKILADMINELSGVSDSHKDGFVTTSKVAWILQRPQGIRKSGDSVTGLSLPHYRIWQVVSKFCHEKDLPEFGPKEFWGYKNHAASNPVHQIGRRLYEERLIPRLLQESNRHIQTLEQLGNNIGLGKSTVYGLLGALQFAYLREGNKLPAEFSLQEARAFHDLVPSEALTAVAETLGFGNVQELVPLDAWVEAVKASPDGSLAHAGAANKRKRFDRNKLSPISEAIMERLQESGFAEPTDIMNALNRRIREAKLTPYATYEVDITLVSSCIMSPTPFGSRASGYEGVQYRRITEVVNEKRAELSLLPLSTEELFGIRRNMTIPLIRELQNQVWSMFLDVLGNARNQGLMTIGRVSKRTKIPEDAIYEMFQNLHLAYQDNGNEVYPLVASPTLAGLAHALGCQPADIVLPDIWEKATQYAKSVISDINETILEDGINDLPSSFIMAAAANRAERLLAVPRVALLNLLSVARQLALGMDSDMALFDAIQCAHINRNSQTLLIPPKMPTSTETPTPTFNAEVLLPLYSGTTPLSGLSIIQEPAVVRIEMPTPEDTTGLGDSASHAEWTAVPDPESSPPDLSIIHEDAHILGEKVSEAENTTEPGAMEDVFKMAAIEVLIAYRGLNIPETSIEYNLLNNIEGLNVRGRKTSVSEAAQQAGLGELEPQDILDILDEVKGKLKQLVQRISMVEISNSSVMDAIRIYQTNITGRVVLGKWIEAGCDDNKNEGIGRTLPTILSSDAVTAIKDRLLNSMSEALRNGVKLSS